MLTVSSPLFVQIMQTNYYKIFKKLKSLEIIIRGETIIIISWTNNGLDLTE